LEEIERETRLEAILANFDQNKLKTYRSSKSLC